ncbi:hypothetical protein GCM10022221_54070 [Actinocorallia aurea]
MDEMTELRDLGRALEHAPPPLTAPEFTGGVRRLPSLRGWPALAVAAAATAAIITVPAVVWSGGPESSPAASAPAQADSSAELRKQATDPATWAVGLSESGKYPAITSAQSGVDSEAPQQWDVMIGVYTSPAADSDGCEIPTDKEPGEKPSCAEITTKAVSPDAEETSVTKLLDTLTFKAQGAEADGSTGPAALGTVQETLTLRLGDAGRRGEFLDALAKYPGAERDEKATDPIGRPAASITIPGTGQSHWEIFYDAATAKYLGGRYTDGTGKEPFATVILDMAYGTKGS